MRPRPLGRRLALQYLYMVDMVGPARAQPLAEFLADQTKPEEEEARAFGAGLIGRVTTGRAAIDESIRPAADNWVLERIAPVERNILRIAALELADGSVPAPVAIDEAVELAKEFGNKDSGGFVNGVLDRIRKSRAGEGAAPESPAR